MSEQKIIAFDSSFIAKTIDGNSNVRKEFNLYKDSRNLKILHDKVIEEILLNRINDVKSGQSKTLNKLNKVLKFILENDFKQWAVSYLDEKFYSLFNKEEEIKFCKEKELARLDTSLLIKDCIKTLDNNQLIQNAKRNTIKGLPLYKTLDDYLNYEKKSDAEFWKQISSNSSSKSEISFDELENIVKNSLTPEVVFKGNNIEKITYPDGEVIYPKSYREELNKDIWVCERFNIMKPTVSFEHSTFPPISGSDFLILSPSSNYRNDLQDLKKNYPYLYFSIQRIHFYNLLENIQKDLTKQKPFQVTLKYNQEISNLKTKEKTEKISFSIDKNFLPDLKIGLLIPLVDEFLTCDKGQYYLLSFLFPEHAEKIKYIAQTSQENP
jgi:hypothetical protein